MWHEPRAAIRARVRDDLLAIQLLYDFQSSCTEFALSILATLEHAGLKAATVHEASVSGAPEAQEIWMSVKVTLLLLGYCGAKREGRGPRAGVSARSCACAPSRARAPTAPPHLGARVRLVLDDNVDVGEDLAVLLRLGHLGYDGLAAALADLLRVRPRCRVPRDVAVHDVARLDGRNLALHPVTIMPIKKAGKLLACVAPNGQSTDG